MIRISRVKLGKSRTGDTELEEAVELCRQLYNAALEERVTSWKQRRVTIGLYDQYRSLTEIRAADEKYRRLPAQMVRATALLRLHLAVNAFFRRLKDGEAPGYPRFKAKGRFSTLVFTRTGWSIEGKHLVLRFGADRFRFRMKNRIHRSGQIRGLRLVKKLGRWWAYFLVDIGPAPAVKKSTNGVGIDVGLKMFATLSNGEQVEHPRFLRKNLKRLHDAHQVIFRKKSGSKRSARAKLVYGKMHAKLVNRRSNFIYQTVSMLVKKYDGFAVERLNIEKMAAKPMHDTRMRFEIRRGIEDSAWGKFMRVLAAKAEEAGLPFVRVNPKGTTQQCSGCGTIVRKGLNDRVHDCAACGLVLDRDVNAARNIRDRGQRSALERQKRDGAETG